MKGFICLHERRIENRSTCSLFCLKVSNFKRIAFLILIVNLLSGCSFYTVNYEVGLKEVECPKDIKDQLGETKVVTIKDKDLIKNSYEDGIIKIVWLPLSAQFNFCLTNKSDHSIKIIWDEAAYVDEMGVSRKIFHSGVKYIERNNSMPPTIIVKGTYVDELILPTDNIYFQSGRFGGWQNAQLFPSSASSFKKLNLLKNKFLGKHVKVLLPIKIEGTTNEYLFNFQIDNFISQKGVR